MAVATVAVDGEMADNLRKVINGYAICGLQVAFKWYACFSFPSLPPSQSH